MNERCTVDDCISRASIFDRDGGFCRTHWDERDAVRRAEEARITQEAGGPWPQTCPRRMEDLGPWEREEGQDTWDIREQLHHGLKARHCSFCGSLHPDDFMEKVRAGWLVGPTDKSYKAYLSEPDSTAGDTKFYFQHLSDEQRREFVDLLNAGRMSIGHPGHFYRLPFFVGRP